MLAKGWLGYEAPPDGEAGQTSAPRQSEQSFDNLAADFMAAGGRMI